MVRFDHREQRFAILLSALAGYVDAVGFLKAGGFFVSFMSGNSTRLAVGLVRGAPSAAVAMGLIGAFILGVMIGTVVAERRKGKQRPILLIVASLLCFAGIADFAGSITSIFFAAAAMGTENTIFARDGDVQIGVTYMTGTLVKFSQSLTYALLGRPNTRWISFGFLWLGLIAGALLGALMANGWGGASFLSASGAALVLSFVASKPFGR